MAVTGWILDNSAATRAATEPVRSELALLEQLLYLCPVGELEQLYSARSADDYDRMTARLREGFPRAEAPPDVLDRALLLQRDLAHHHGMWHRIAISDLLIAETALHHGFGVVHVDRHYDRIAEIRPLTARRVG